LTSTPGPVDLVTSVASGMGGVARVTYESVALHSGAVQPTTTTCGGGAGTACGIPSAGPRPLATRVTGETGRGFVHGETYTYANGRYKPGPVEAIGTTPVRADLGFEVEARDIARGALAQADELFLTGTAAEVVPVREVDDHPIGPPGEITKAIQSRFFATIQGKRAEYLEWLEFVEMGAPEALKERPAAVDETEAPSARA
jgi:hypothetical protein